MPVRAQCSKSVPATSLQSFDSLQIHCAQARSQKFALGRLFWRLETTSNGLDPNFCTSSLRLSRFLSQNSGDLKKKKNLGALQQKNVVIQAETQFFWSIPCQLLDQFLSQIPLGGAIFVFSAKIGLKMAKNRVFWILFRPIGRSSSPPPPLATLLTAPDICANPRSFKAINPNFLIDSKQFFLTFFCYNFRILPFRVFYIDRCLLSYATLITMLENVDIFFLNLHLIFVSLERPTLATHVFQFLLGHFQTNECEVSYFC